MTFSLSIYAEGDISIRWAAYLGNILFQFATVYSVAKKNEFEIVANRNEILEKFSLAYQITDQYFFKNIFDEGLINHNILTQHFNPGVYDLPSGTCIIGHFQTDKYFIQHRNALLELFTFKDESVYEKAKLVLSKSREISICAHMRFGDYSDFLKQTFEKKNNDKYYQKADTTFPVMDHDYYTRAIKCIMNKLNVSIDKCSLFLITDDPRSNILKLLINRLLKALPSLEVIVVDKDDDVNFAMMNLCDVCVTGASSYSWWGAWLNRNAKMIVSPKYWFNYYLPHKKMWLPNDIEMSLGNQYFIESRGYLEL